MTQINNSHLIPGEEFPRDKTIHQLFQEQVEKTPDYTALVGKEEGGKGGREKESFGRISNTCGEMHLTYRELNEKSNQLAHYLEEKGVQPETIVGLMVERSIAMVIGVLGILKAGGAYLPIDPRNPENRTRLLLADSGINVVITSHEIASLHPVSPGVKNRPAASLAYILYTSGSTGVPKGVIVEHRSVVNLLFALFKAYPLARTDVYLLKTSFFFDVSVTELFGWFMGGGRLVLLEKGGEKDPQIIINTTAKHQVTHINFAPAMFNTFTRQLDAENIEGIASLKYIFLAGEALVPELVNRFRRFKSTSRLENLYGPTEGTVYASWYSLAEWDGTGSIPIGKPLPNVTLHIVDKTGHPTAIGETGELCIAGEGTARGYLNNPELTSERFDQDYHDEKNQKFLRGSRGRFLQKEPPGRRRQKIYKTGDLARFLPDGNIDFLGRIDHQVKIRGRRIELGEIESRLLNHQGVKEAVVTARETNQGDKYLCAYIVPKVMDSQSPSSALAASRLKEYLTTIFPDYMIPQFFILLERLPLSRSGKVDRKALPAPVFNRETQYTAPRNWLEEKLVEIWSSALGIEKESIGIDDGFLESGGHSLTGAAVVYDIHKIFDVKITFSQLLEMRVIRKLAAVINGAVKEQYLPLEKAEKKEYYPLSPAQKRMYILYHMNPENTVYNFPALFELAGVADRERLEDTFKKLIKRHQSFRTGFVMVKGEPVQRIKEQAEFKIKYYRTHELHELTQIKTTSNKKLLQGVQGGGFLEKSPPGRRRQNFIRPFDLSRAPLLRVGLIELLHTPAALRGHPRRGTYNSQEGKKGKYLLMIDMHHIITDGFSMMVFMDEFTAFYHSKPLLPLQLQYKDYSEWHYREKRKGYLESQRDYWLKEYSHEISLLSLPLDYTRPLLQSFEGDTLYVELEDKDIHGIKALARAEGVTLYMLFLAAYNILLAKLSGQEDIVVGTPLSGRKRPDLYQTMGMFVNTLAVRTFPRGEKRFYTFLQEVKEKTLTAFENQEYPFEELIEAVVPQRDFSRNPLFDCVFALETLEPYQSSNDLKMNPCRFTWNISKFDLTLTVEEYKEEMILRVEYCTKLFKLETLHRFIDYFRRILRSLRETPGQAISEIEIISEQEKERLLFDFNHTGPGYSRDETLHRLFQVQVDRTPDHTALIEQIPNSKFQIPNKGVPFGRVLNAFGEMQLSYRELDGKSNQLAYGLIEKGVRPDTIVALMTERSPEMIVGILGILKAGGAYLPIDPEYPEERVNYMITDLKVNFLVKKRNLFSHFTVGEGVDTIFIDGPINKNPPKGTAVHLHPAPAPATSLAYVIFTSGSTGKPKGVPITHSNISPLLYWGLHRLVPGPNDHVVQNLSYYFDWSVWEIFITLACGASLYITSPLVLLNPKTCVSFIKKNDITVLHITPTQFHPLVQWMMDSGQKLESLKYLFIGAEKLTLDLVNRGCQSVTGDCRVFNMYGPTEATIISAVLEINKPDNEKHKDLSSIPIGKPVANTNLLILDRHFNLCPVHIAGELVIGGDGLSRGYLNNPDLTNQKFLRGGPGGAVFSKSAPPGRRRQKFYQTGDLARWLADGNIEFLGRIDHQVKIRGFRIEIGEIENQLLDHNEIKEAVVTALEGSANHETYLCAYFVSNRELSVSGLREYLLMKLPDYMIPAFFMQMEKLPVNPNGKIDRKRLPKPEEYRPKLDSDYEPPTTEIENMISRAWQEVLKLDKVGIHDKFFELGGNSMKFIQVNDRLQEYLGEDIPVVTMYQYPTIHSLARYLSEEAAVGEISAARVTPGLSREHSTSIAVIGMAGRFPGAKNIDEFWQNLKNGVEAISFFSEAELEEVGIGSELLNNPNYVKARGFLEDLHYFDALFFNYTPREADWIDPQLRLYHECSWAALEDAGYNPETYTGRIGVYSGASPHVLWTASTLNEALTPSEYYDATVLNINSSFSTRISYLFGLRGPSFSIQTACSTSLVAVHLACRGLLDGECHIALAGGVSVSSSTKSGYLYQDGMILSPDGHNRTFAAEARGTVPGDGIGIVVLKPLKEAIADRDYIYAVVKGSAINNDGTRKVGYTAPSVDGQTEVIREALDLAKVKPGSITYVETHGTATTMGDPIEIRGLKLAFKHPAGALSYKNNSCTLGSVKSNIGHLDMAAGIAGFIKTVLALNHRLIPPSLHFESPNPEIKVENSPFVVNTQLTQWKANEYPRRAGVSAFGIGGTNAHVILEEFIEGTGGLAPLPIENPSHRYQLILLSAKTPSALEHMTQNLALHFKQHPGINLADAAYTLQVGRKAFKQRRILVCSHPDEAVEMLESPGQAFRSDAPQVYTRAAEEKRRPVVFMFPGQGSQYVNMGLGLYQSEVVFREQMDRCFKILKGLADYDIKEVLYPGEMQNRSNRSNINQTEIAQPVIFAFEYALAKLLMHWGIRPDALIGHSIGEYTAACLSGVLSLEDGLTLVAARGQMMQSLPRGSMLSVPLPEKEILALLKNELCLAAVNSPGNCVVSGPQRLVDAFAHQLKEMGHKSRALHTSHAFHSTMMEPILEAFANKVKQVTLNPPYIPYLSNVTGRWITAEAAVDPGYWPTHLRRTVRFYDGMTELLKKEENPVLLEVGPGRVLSTFVRQHPNTTSRQPTLNLVRHLKENIPDDEFLLTKIGNLWLRGTTIDWEAFYPGETGHRIPLPTYPFEKHPHRIQRKFFPHSTAGVIPGIGTAGESQLTRKTAIGDWFYTLSWKRVQLPFYKKGSLDSHTPWLVFINDHGTGTRLIEFLEKENQELILVKQGASFQKKNARAFILDPGQEGDYKALFSELASMTQFPRRILHLWGLSEHSSPPRAPEFKEVEQVLEVVFYSLLNIARTLGTFNIKDKLHIDVVTSHMHEVTGEERLCPAKAAVLGPVKAIPLEYPNIRCRSIDVTGHEEPVLEQLLAELSREVRDPAEVVALRRCYRWVQGIEPLHLETLPKPMPRLKENGIYLVTGGLGGMGLALARYLAKTVKARLALIDWSPLPPPGQWKQWLNTHPENNKTSRKIQEIREMEKSGANILVFNANIADWERMKQVMEKIENTLGKINGVIHTAGAGDGRLIQLRTREFTGQILAPKVKGTLVLDALLQSHQPDFIVLCSSLNSLIGEIGQAGYIAANCFLDAFAAAKRFSGGVFTVSINWDGWQEVGMAVEGTNRETVISRLNPGTHWELGEHKVMGIPTLVGTAYLEMAAAALEYDINHRDIEIRHLHYLSPLTAPGGEETNLHTFMEREENQNRWQFSMGTPLNRDNRYLQVHARGNIEAVKAAPPRMHNIADIRKKCPQHIQVPHQVPETPGETVDVQSQVVNVGPRWDNLREIWLGKNQGLARLELHGEFSTDIRSHLLHPALLDSATAFLISYISPGTAYLPFSFKRVRIKKPLPLRVFSFARQASQPSQSQALELDITIMDETGRELIDIEGLTVVALPGARPAHPPPGAPAANNANKEVITREPGKSKQTNDLKDGILPHEGVEVFARVLADNFHQVLVSTVDLPLRLEREKYRPAHGLFEPSREESHARPTHPRPELSTPYVPPETETQQTLVRNWQEFLGIRQVGIHDDIFELGADSLKALTVIARIHKELNVEVSITDIFTYPTVARLAAYIESNKESIYSSIAPVEAKEYYPLSSAQKRLYYLWQMHQESVFYNLPIIFTVSGPLHTGRLQKAVLELTRRHDSLRTSFEVIDEEPVQRVWHGVINKARLRGRQRQIEIGDIIDDFVRPFDLSHAPLMRMEILQIDKEKYLWLFDIHHIITDATGYAVLQKDLEKLYNNQELAAVKVQYRDFSRWQNRLLISGKIKAQQDYWLQVFHDGVPGLNLPTDYPRPGVSTFEGAMHHFKLPMAETLKFSELGSSAGTTLFINLLTVLYVLLFKYTGQGDIVIGTSTAGRPHADLQDIVGMFVNILAVRTYLDEDMTYPQLLYQVKTTALKALENQDMQFEMLVQQLNLETGTSQNPFFDICLNVENYDQPTFDMEGLTFTPYPYETNTSKFDMLLWANRVKDEIHFMLEYSGELYKPSSAENFSKHFIEIIQQVIDNSDVMLKDIKISYKILMPESEVPEIDFAF
ncbi:MAG: amino acid adenylation domain-containing protein [Candidatus Aminicenantes bacterium]